MSVKFSNSSLWRTAVPGMAAMGLGLGLAGFELASNFMLNRVGVAGQWLVFIAGTGLSIWGLKEIITAFWPKFGQRGMRFRLPQEGLIYLVIMIVLFVGALMGRSNTLMMVFALLAGPLIMNGNMAYVMLRRLWVLRELPPRVMAGEPFTVTLTLQNRKSWLSIWVMRVRDLITHERGILWGEVLFMRVAPGGERRGHYELRLWQRGEYTFGPITVDTRFPLGLIERGIGIPTVSKLLVYPRLGRMLPSWRKRVFQATELVSQVRPQPGPFNDDLHRIREYRTGDDPRMIHWRTAARLNQLMVKEYRESRDRHLELVVDLWQEPGETEAAVEKLLRLAATLAVDQLRHSRETALNVRLCGRTVLNWIGEVGEGQLEQLLDLFARVQPTSKSVVGELLTETQRHRDSNRRLLILSTRPAEWQAAMQATGSADLWDTQVQILGLQDEELEKIYVDEQFAEA